MRFAWEFLWRAFQSTLDFLDTPVRVVYLTFCLIAVVAGIELLLKVRKAGAREGLRGLLRSWKENVTIATVVVVIAYILLFAASRGTMFAQCFSAAVSARWRISG